MTDPQSSSFYDGEDVAARYSRHRWSGTTSPNEVMEEPAFLDAVGDVTGLRIIDIGCGDAAFGHHALSAGCRSYLGVDSSTAMVAQARSRLEGTAGTVRRGAAESVALPPGSADLVVSRLALHHVEDLLPVLTSCFSWLSGAGRLVVTVLHPLITAPLEPTVTSEARTAWTVDDYFVPGPRRRSWMGSEVVWYHRTVEDHVDLLTRAGFSLRLLRECPPAADRFEGDEAELVRRRRVPLFLLLDATRT